MPFTVKYTPPKVNASAKLGIAARLAEHEMAAALLEVSQKVVPVDKARLRESGTVTDTPNGAYVGYGFDDGDGHDAPTSAYAVIQHESLDFAHPHGGSAKYLEAPMNSEGPAILAAGAVSLRKIF